jgi:FtsP/CotA-like multicopper oxidase with cupredoxin domain
MTLNAIDRTTASGPRRHRHRLERHRAGAGGQTVDILLDVSNPGLWMAHCHIAERAESGMMFSFNVTRTPAPVR